MLACKRDDREVILADRTDTQPRASASGFSKACPFGRITARVIDEDDEAVQPMCAAMANVDHCLPDASTAEDLHFDIEVGPDARVTVSKSEPGGDPALVACVASLLRGAVFPAGVEREFCYVVTIP